MPECLSVAVVIPCFKVRPHILAVIARMPDIVDRIYVVDDACPDASGQHVAENCRDPRVTICRNERNLGVGGAVLHGYAAALADGMDVVVKIDGDGQMDPSLIPAFIAPILRGEADYTKGNRFFDLGNIRHMPTVRIFGNAVLSFMTKLSSGYWDIFDPTNGYTAIHAGVARRLPTHRISQRYFFESDMLFRLNTLRAVVTDIPMDACYGEEVSNLRVSRVASDFLLKHLRNFGKRIFYNYYLRDLSLASLELILGLMLLLAGVAFGIHHWLLSIQTGIQTTAGTVMLSALPIILGLQFLLGFIGHDIASVPKKPIHPLSLPATGKAGRPFN